MDYEVRGAPSVSGTFKVPGDKSISHRALLFSSLASGKSEIRGLSTGADVKSTMSCLKQLGVKIEQVDGMVTVRGAGKSAYSRPDSVLDAGNSGTTMRLLTGILAGQQFETTITGDETLRKRPMQRIVGPLTEMGAEIVGSDKMTAPLRIFPSRKLHGIRYELPLPSAQVKSSVLLAGMFAEGETVVVEPVESRDHTERMLKLKKVKGLSGLETVISSDYRVEPQYYDVAGDISSAAFFLAAGAILPNSSVTACGITLNPTRTGFLDVLKSMGANVRIENVREAAGEPIGDVTVSHSNLKGVDIGGGMIPRLIDELPIIGVMAAFAEGETVVHDAHDLRRKESDRIVAVVDNLDAMGADVRELDDGFSVNGTGSLSGAEVDSYKDHRIAMAFTIAGLAAKGTTLIKNAEWAEISFPEFFGITQRLVVRS
ncbi:MAG: 3-phosphoshikimate 1-carboxyvinyltransferase [Bacteroidetes bacterium]|jgi:3-phosphoshikimate 1-carboxyvinyltransferase|nr:3-phosphoshikimate 1-carboxyvinyltransferase [Bacteroidota bacterium]